MRSHFFSHSGRKCDRTRGVRGEKLPPWRTSGTSRRRDAASSPPSTRLWSRTSAAARSGSWRPTTSSTASHRPRPTPASGARASLTRIAGLFELAPGFYQLRGFDLSNMHVVEGEEGIVVIDPLVSAETAAAALALYREHRGERPVTGLIYTHSHVDHFGGAKGGRLRGGGRGRPGAGPRPGRLPPPRGQRERLRRHRDGTPRRLHVRGAARARTRRDRSAPASGRPPRWARSP